MGTCFSLRKVYRPSIKQKTPVYGVQNVYNYTDSEIDACHCKPTVGNYTNIVIDDCLSKPDVLRRILQRFSDAELLKLSYVNKLWNYEARSVMKKRGNLVAHIESDNKFGLHKNIRAFGLDLQRMNIAAFSALSINLLCCYPAPFPTGALDGTFEAIQDRLSLKHFSVRLIGDWYHNDCPILLLIKRVLHHFSQVLESLTIDVDGQNEAFMQKVVQYCEFPHLNTLKLYQNFSPCEPESDIVMALLFRAPNLQQLQGLQDINLIQKLLEKSQVANVSTTQARAPFNEIPDSVVHALRLEGLQLEYTGPEFNYERFNTIAPILLQVCSTTTLREVIIDAVLAVPLMCYRVCLKNVKILSMQMNYNCLELVEPRILTIVKNFDFTYIFPSLDLVTIDGDYHFHDLSPGHMNSIVEKANAVSTEPQPFRAVNIKQLNLKDTLSSTTAPFFAEMFPNVEKLEITPAQEEQVPFGSIWKHWKNLEQLRIFGRFTANLDSVICGIFPEPVRDLDVMELDRVHIVPVITAIPCFRNPKAFTLVFCQSQDNTLMFSKQTGLVTLPRCPTLIATFKTTLDDIYEALQYIKFYTSLFHPDDCAGHSDHCGGHPDDCTDHFDDCADSSDDCSDHPDD